MKIKLLLIVLIALIGRNTNAQTEKCGTMKNLEKMMKNDPSLKDKMIAGEKKMQEWIKIKGRLNHISEYSKENKISINKRNGTFSIQSLCGYNNTLSATITAPVSLHQIVSPSPNCTHGGEYVTVTGLIAGNIYRISTCGLNNFDTQITIYPQGGGQAVAHNDDWCGLQSEITFNPFISGNYDILIDKIDCTSNSLCALLAVELVYTPRPVITIPVVVHVIHFGEAVGTGRNISTVQILSQITVLNECYRRLNSDINITPAAFRGISDDALIEFCLATQDEFGNPTNGIDRVLGVQSSYNSGELDALEKPRTIWDKDKYLNLWTCDDAGDGAYASFPGEPDSLDGVVVPYYYFGSVGNVSQPFALGKTAVHEIGHWLNLYHIWGDAIGCNTDDSVADTPLQDDNNPFGTCPVFPQTDNCSPNYPGIMYFNQMDYSGDDCLTMFTPGQTTRIDAAIANYRLSLLTSQGCLPVGINDFSIAKKIKVFPNPSDGKFTIQLNEKNINSKMVITNMIGEIIFSKIITEKKTDLNLSEITNGVYIISILSANGKFNEKLILKK